MALPNWQLVNIIISLVASGLSFGLMGYAWRRGAVQGARWFSVMMLAAGWVSFFYAWESAAGADLSAYLTFSKIEYAGLTLVPLTWIGLALEMNGHSISRRGIALLASVPVITIALAWTNEWHGLIWANASFEMITMPPIFHPEYGGWFFVYTAFAYLLYLIGGVLLAISALRTWNLYRMQSILLLTGTAIPWVSNLAEIFDLSPVPGLYTQPIGVGLCSLCLGMALLRFRLFDIMPLAHHLIVQNIPQGVAVVDTLNRVVALNQAMHHFLDHPQKSPIGEPFVQAFSKFADDISVLLGSGDQTITREIDGKYIEVKASSILDPHQQIQGRLLVFDDVTTVLKAEQARQEQQALADVLREYATQLNSNLDSSYVLSLIVNGVSIVLPHDRANIMLFDDDGFTGYIYHHSPFTPESAELYKAMRFDYRRYPVWAQAVEEETVVIIPDTTHDPEWYNPEVEVEVGSYAAVPLRAHGKLIGILNVASLTPGTFKKEAAQSLQVFADQAAFAIQNARLYEQVSKQAEELNRRVYSLTVLQRVYKDLGFSSNIDHLIEMSLDAAIRVCMADAGYVGLMHDGKLRPVHFYGKYSRDQLESILDEQQGIIAQVIEEEGGVMLTQDDDLRSALAGTRAQIAVPLYSSDATTLMGVIVVETLRPERFTDERFQTFGLLANRIASALENARLVKAVEAHAAHLEQLYKRVSDLEQIKTDMIRIAAHDLKNPLNVLIGYLDDIVHESPDTPMGDYQKIFTAMDRASNRMRQIISDILSLERIENMQHNNLEPFNLCKLVQDATAEYADRAVERHQVFEVTLEAGDACVVSGDPAQIREAVTNFISNAIKYTPNGGNIRVTLSQTPEGVRFQVCDTGYGIPDDQQTRLFEPFFRARTTETKKIDGTGLGLYLVRNIIERHHGKLIFQSTYQKGSTFGFTLPAAEMALAN